MTIKIVIIVYPDLFREKTTTVVPRLLIAVGIGGLVGRGIVPLLVSLLLEGQLLELLVEGLLFLPHRMEGREDLVVVPVHVQRLVGATVQAGAIGLELQALSCVMSVLDGRGPLGAVLAELGGRLARRGGLC